MKHVTPISVPRHAQLPDFVCSLKAVLRDFVGVLGIECPCYEPKCGDPE